MDVGRRRVRSGVAAGSIWESRMIMDVVKGGIKVFNGDEVDSEQVENQSGVKAPPRRLKPFLQMGKRKTWKSNRSSSDGSENPTIQIAKKSSDEEHEQQPGNHGIKISPIPRKNRSEISKELVSVGDGSEKSPVQLRKTRSEKGVFSGESVDGKKNPIQLRKTKSESNKVLDEPNKDSVNGSKENVEKKNPADDVKEAEKSEETCKELDICEEKSITSSLDSGIQAKFQPNLLKNGDEDEEDEENEEYEAVDDELEIENNSNSFDIKEIDMPIPPETAPRKSILDDLPILLEGEPKKSLVNEEKMKANQFREKPAHTSGNWSRLHPPSPSSLFGDPSAKSNVKKLSFPTAAKQSARNFEEPRNQSLPNLTNLRKPSLRTTNSTVEEFQEIPESNSKLQNLVDLVMWRDVSKSTLVFGIGTFVMLSTSYTDELNISFISVMSYISLLYLAAIFVYKSIICRGAVDTYDSSQYYVVGEDEAIWLLRLFLPYINEFLLKLRSLFSGDPCTTMKLAVLLFLLARNGSSITIWKMAKLGFFGAFTLPKVYSLYSTQIRGYGHFWIRRFQDAWESCSHKKAVAGAIFTIVWNLSSVVARVWAVFLLFVAVRYYQQSSVNWVEDDEVEDETWKGQVVGGRQRRKHGATLVGLKKEKKAS